MDNNDNFKLRYLIIAVLVIVGSCTCFHVARTISEREAKEIIVTDTVQVLYELSDWQLFQLALIEIESEYDSDAISSEGARGIFQEMPIYIRDVNRIIGTEWKSTDAHNDTIALDCFTVIQRTYNPERDIERAIYLHNPTAGPWYKRRIMDKMADIRRREQVRTLIITY